ncbi:MAG: arginase family protein [Gemmataceae bacterium]|nr:arginase family protein [Gemmataceae bacterium]
MKTHAHFFPFALFGHPGTQAGAELLADAVRELLADARKEKTPNRSKAFARQVVVEEHLLETMEDLVHWLPRARDAVRAVWAKNDFLLWSAGNHLGVLPVYEELTGTDTLVVQFDAHLDVYNLEDCATELGHGNFLLHADKPLPPIINVGHREQVLDPAHVAKTFVETHSAIDLARDPDAVIAKLKARCENASRVVIDIDCDAFDPVHFPAVAQPEPFGLTPLLFLRLLDAVWSDRVVGLAVSEFDPSRDRHDMSLALLLWLVEHVLLRIYER